jgi:hypothetical protein
VKTKYLTNENIKVVRNLGLKSAQAIMESMNVCGCNRVLEPLLWQAFHEGYDQGLKIGRKEAEEARPKKP